MTEYVVAMIGSILESSNCVRVCLLGHINSASSCSLEFSLNNCQILASEHVRKIMWTQLCLSKLESIGEAHHRNQCLNQRCHIFAVSLVVYSMQPRIQEPTWLPSLEKYRFNCQSQRSWLCWKPQQTCDVSIFFRSIDPNQLTHVAFGDASFASPKQLSCFQGTLVFATTPQLSQLHQNQTAPISPISWSSKKISRVVRSTLSAEAFSMSSVDQMSWCRLLWGTLVVPEFHWRNPPEAFRHMHAAVVVTDCKSLCDLVSRRAMPSCAEYRATLEVLLIKERCLEHCNFGWIPTALRLADPLTKNMDATLLRAVLGQGSFQLLNEDANFQMNAHKKQAIQWIRESHQKEDSRECESWVSGALVWLQYELSMSSHRWTSWFRPWWEGRGTL